MRFRYGISIINWMNYKETVECLDFLFKQGIRDTLIVVLENGSPNDSKDQIKFFLSSRSIIATDYSSYGQIYTFADNVQILLDFGKVNLGFSGGCNRCISFLSKESVESIFLLNSDARISFADLEILGRLSKERNAIIGPKIFDMDGEIAFSGRTWPKLLWSMGEQRFVGTYDTGYVEGSACMIPIEFVHQKILRDGYVFDERFFLYCEDVDLCLSAASMGCRVLMTDLAQASHKISASSGGEGSLTAYYYLTRNRILLSKKWLSFGIRFFFLLYYYTSRFVMMLSRLSSRQGRRINRAVFQGLKDGFLNRFGASA